MKNIISATLALTILLIVGCGNYTPNAFNDKKYNVNKTSRIVILPFSDTRTFHPKGEVDAANAGRNVANTFATSLGKFFSTKKISVLKARSAASVTCVDAMKIAKQHKADLVVDGQLFSFIGRRALTISPRAGMFVRIFSAKDKKLVFAGDIYKSMKLKRGGQLKQIELITDALAKSFAHKKTEAQTIVANSPKVLMLPYVDIANKKNLIENPMGGEVVSTIIQTEFASTSKVKLLYPDAAAKATHEKLLTPEQCIALAKKAGAEYVVRGVSTQFNRAKSVPNVFSALISSTLLVTQVTLAEISGVEFATEIWRVSDGRCVFAIRDKCHQKFVVQAENTVRFLTGFTVPKMTTEVWLTRNDKEQFPVLPIIDALLRGEEIEDNVVVYPTDKK